MITSLKDFLFFLIFLFSVVFILCNLFDSEYADCGPNKQLENEMLR